MQYRVKSNFNAVVGVVTTGVRKIWQSRKDALTIVQIVEFALTLQVKLDISVIAEGFEFVSGRFSIVITGFFRFKN